MHFSLFLNVKVCRWFFSHTMNCKFSFLAIVLLSKITTKHYENADGYYLLVIPLLALLPCFRDTLANF